MYSNNNKAASSFDNSITVTPIKVEVSMSQSYPTLGTAGGSVAVAATTSVRRPITNPPSMSATTYAPATTTTTISCPTGATPKERSTKASRTQASRKPPPTLDTFWPILMTEVRLIQQVDAKHQSLPLARIKKIMKLDENAKMIAAEAPLLFSKACEYFIQELTMRAWIHTEDSKRRTLQRSDIAQAIANYDQFDFLIDIVPREDIKPSTHGHKRETHTPASSNNSANTSCNLVTPPTTTVNLSGGSGDVKMDSEILHFTTLTQDGLTLGAATTHQQQTQPVHPQQLQIIQHTAAAAHPQQLQYFITIPGVGQQGSGQAQILQQLHMPQQQQLTNGLTPHLTSLNLLTQHHQPQQLILTAGPNGQLTATPAPTAAQQTLAAHQQQQQQQNQHIQLLQQVVTPNGELTNVPITISANQLNLLRLQMQQQQQPQQQQVLIPTQCLTAQPLLQLQASHNASQTVQLHQQQQQQQQQQQHNIGETTSIYLNVPHAVSQAQTHSTNSIVSTDRNLGSTFRPNC